MYVDITKKIFGGAKDKCVTKIHTMRHVAYVDFSKGQITNHIIFSFFISLLFVKQDIKT